MTQRDYYDVLGIQRDASYEDITKSYKKLAFEYHPDRNPGNAEAEEKFKEINEAYQILNNSEKRARYDSFGHMSSENVFSDENFSSGFNDIFGNLFEDVFSAGSRNRAQQGNDLKYSLHIAFEEAIDGTEKLLNIPKRKSCGECDGVGAAPGGTVTCDTCQGSGELKYTRGFIAIKRHCSSCGGSGRRIIRVCSACAGNGFVITDQSVKIKVPPGITDGARLRIRGEGDTGFYGGPPGDLYIEISVEKHPLFSRDGEDLYCNVPISFVQAALGDEIEIPTVKGKSTIKIHAGTQSGQSFRLKGMGVPRLQRRGVGDLYINVQVEVPVKLNNRQKELLEEFALVSEEKSDPMKKRFFDKLHSLFNRD